MNLVTYNYISLKCYINLITLFYIVPAEKESPQTLARAIVNFYCFLDGLKKMVTGVYFKFIYFRLQILQLD